MKKFRTNYYDDEADVEIVSVREEFYGGDESKKKVCITSQPIRFEGLCHSFLIAYIMGNKLFVVPDGLRERGLELRVFDNEFELPNKVDRYVQDEKGKLCKEGENWKYKAEHRLTWIRRLERIIREFGTNYRK